MPALNPKLFVILFMLTSLSGLSSIVVGHDRGKLKGVKPVDFPLYKEECGSCHFAYPAGLLPKASWQQIMASLDKHFGDNAELDPQTEKAILGYLSGNSAESSSYRRSRKILRSLRNGKIPARITEIPYIKHEHDEVPQRLVQGNKQVQSFSHCDRCHKNATQGSFSEKDIDIPGYGRWDD